MCAGSRIYEINRDAQNAGRHGCDPPWGYIATGYTNHPGSCCRTANDGAVVKGEEGSELLTIEESPVAKDAPQ
ncbi:hypothetical protein CMUS01_06048 [Colletotrichum musicola]|uniref:Uncharacterized protein n=3 Tax=Colletotrichum orchidearum species complex TaxID=2707337 RepID=A0A8H6KPV4_9PEZI|nr:hypothetical protein CSOJ01_13647 [Colletotrichum sojae]KAF6822256.1 hypothetical protein CPLU01_12116 [Colletotrichum plurivorum]KAF6834731.1 hypothetical protein CMUS01_06048 [Colletotrichum musicola]